MFQPKSRGGEPTRETHYTVPKAFRSCPPHITHAAYLEPISGSMHVPIEEVYRVTEKIKDRSRIGVFRCQWHVEKALRVYLERIRNRMHKPIEGSTR